jgi:ketosteroid isomerase-like protein
MEAAKIAAIVNETQDALLARDIDRYVALLAEDVVVLDPAAPPLQGRAAARKFVESLVGMLSEMTFVERKVIPFGRSAAMRFTLKVKTNTGKEGVMEGVDIFEFDDADLIRKITSYYDPSALAALAG